MAILQMDVKHIPCIPFSAYEKHYKLYILTYVDHIQHFVCKADYDNTVTIG